VDAPRAATRGACIGIARVVPIDEDAVARDEE